MVQFHCCLVCLSACIKFHPVLPCLHCYIQEDCVSRKTLIQDADQAPAYWLLKHSFMQHHVKKRLSQDLVSKFSQAFLLIFQLSVAMSVVKCCSRAMPCQRQHALRTRSMHLCSATCSHPLSAGSKCGKATLQFHHDERGLVADHAELVSHAKCP